MVGNEGILDDQGLGAAALHAGGEPVVTNLVVAARQYGEAVDRLAFGILPPAADDGPLGVVAAAAPAHLAVEQHAALHLFHLAERGDGAAGCGIRALAPDFVLQLRGEHRQLVAVGAQQAEGPGGAGAGAGQGDHAIGEFRQGDFHAAVVLRLQRAVQADTLEHGDVLFRHLAQLLGLRGVGGDGRQDGLEVVEEGIWLFHVGALLIVRGGAAGPKRS
ncbi:hypothetical protein D3C85_430500 [compost metagenome]